MAPRSSILAWRIPWTLEPGGLQNSFFRFKKFSAIISSNKFLTLFSLSFFFFPSGIPCYKYGIDLLP